MDSDLKPEGESLREQSNLPDVADGRLPAYLCGGFSAERSSTRLFQPDHSDVI